MNQQEARALKCEKILSDGKTCNAPATALIKSEEQRAAWYACQRHAWKVFDSHPSIVSFFEYGHAPYNDD
jgi:hypothetical protein